MDDRSYHIKTLFLSLFTGIFFIIVGIGLKVDEIIPRDITLQNCTIINIQEKYSGYICYLHDELTLQNLQELSVDIRCQYVNKEYSLGLIPCFKIGLDYLIEIPIKRNNPGYLFLSIGILIMIITLISMGYILFRHSKI